MASKQQKNEDFNIDEKAILDKEVQFLKKRLDQCKKENDVLKKDNKVLRDEMGSLKDTVKNIALARPKTAIDKNKTVQNEDQLRFVLEYQRKRIDEVEKDLDTYKNKYEQLLYQKQRQSKSNADGNISVRPESIVLAEQYSQSSDQVNDLKKQNEQLEEKIKLITTQYSQEMVQLKTKIAKQDAILFTNNNSNLSNSNFINGNQNAVYLSGIQSNSSLSYNQRSKVSLDPLQSPQVSMQSSKNYGNNYNNMNSSINNNAVSQQSNQNNNSNFSIKQQRTPSLSNIQSNNNNNDSIFSYKKKNF